MGRCQKASSEVSSFRMHSFLYVMIQAPGLTAQKHGSPVGRALAFSKPSLQCFCADALNYKPIPHKAPKIADG